MKRFALASLLVLCLLVLAACKNAAPPQGDEDKEKDAAEVLVTPAYLSFAGTSTASLSITADGRWTAESAQEWLTLSPASGNGNALITITIDRSGLPPGDYAGSIQFHGAEPEQVVTVSMRFPTVTGTVRDPKGQLTPAGLTTAATAPAPEPAALDQRPYVPGEVLVLLDMGMARVIEANSPGLQLQSDGASLSTLASMAGGLAQDYSVVASDPSSTAFPLVLIETSGSVASAERVEEVVAALRLDGRVAHAQPNYLIERPLPKSQGPAFEPAEAGVIPAWEAQWHYHNIDLGGAWAVTQGTQDVTVAVIDSGFAVNHPDLALTLLTGYDFGEGDTEVDGRGAICGDHATHVAGTVAAAYNESLGTSGIAPRVKVLPLEIGDSSEGCMISSYYLSRAITYAAGLPDIGAGTLPKPVDVINLSLGSFGLDEVVAQAVAQAIDQGVTVVAAAGNEEHGPVNYPAALPGVIGVSATDYFDELAYYSNIGEEIDLAAPGGDASFDNNGDGYADGVLSLTWDFGAGQPTYSFYEGTSMASPHVAGVAALMKSVNRDLSPMEVQALLASSATPLDNHLYYGAGLLNAGAAVLAAQGALTATYAELTVRLSQEGADLQEVGLANDGSFEFLNIPAGSYTLEAGTDVDGDGVLGEPGEFYVTATLDVAYIGDASIELIAHPQ